MNVSEYRERYNAAAAYASANQHPIGWDGAFIAGLFRNGLQLVQNEAWLLIYEFAWRAPVPVLEKDLWPYDTWIIPR